MRDAPDLGTFISPAPSNEPGGSRALLPVMCQPGTEPEATGPQTQKAEQSFARLRVEPTT